jgi:ABC-type nitrate/sulfonate/bicarbonate transport system permease component
MAGRWLTTIRGEVPRTASIILGFIPVVALIALWAAMTHGPVEERRISPTILPSPVEVVQSIPALFNAPNPDNRLVHNTFISLKRIAWGYLTALLIVLPLGILMGSFGSFRSLFSPLTTASGYIPIATLVPLTISWFGTDDFQKVMFLAIAFSIYLLPMIVTAIEAVPDVYLRTAYTLGASRLQVIFQVLIPIALPAIWQGMRLAFGVGWTYLALTEVVSINEESRGLGGLIAIAQRRGPREHIYLVIIVITLIAWVADLGWTTLGRWLFPYRTSRR